MTESAQALARLRRRAFQFLVHSFLYYRLGESVISDEAFDRLTAELRALRRDHPGAPMPHGEVVDAALGPEGSGFQIRRYPPQVVSAAFKLLYAAQAPAVEFREFVERRGYRLEIEGRSELD
jgi:hypothetical protein